MTELTDNYALQTSLNRQKSLLLLKYDDNRPTQCQSCFREDEIRARCLHEQCQKSGFLCESCEQAHEEMVVFKDHNVITLKDMTESTKITLRKCSKHPMYSLSLFCMPCLKVVCQKCAASEHRNSQHNIAKISEKSKEYRNSLKKRVPKLKQVATQFRKQAAQAEHYQELLTSYKEKAKQMASRAHIAKFMSQLLLDSEDMEFMQLYPEVHAAVEDINDSDPGELPCIHTTLAKGSCDEEEGDTVELRNEHESEPMDVDFNEELSTNVEGGVKDDDDANESQLYSTPNGHNPEDYISDVFQSFTDDHDERASVESEESDDDNDDVVSNVSSTLQLSQPKQRNSKRQRKQVESDDDVASNASNDVQLLSEGPLKGGNSKRQRKKEESDYDMASNASSNSQLPSKGQPKNRNSKRQSKKEESDDDIASNASSHSQLPPKSHLKHRNSKRQKIDDDWEHLVEEEDGFNGEEDCDDELQSDNSSQHDGKLSPHDSKSSLRLGKTKQNNQSSSSWDRVGKFGKMGKALGDFYFARGVAVSPKSNTIAVADHSTNRVDLFTLDGKFKVTLKSRRAKKGKGTFRDAEDVAFNSNENLFVVDGSRFVQEYSIDGNFLKKFSVLNNETVTKVCSSCIAVGNDDRIYVGDCEPSRSLVSVFKKNGIFIRTVKLSVLPMYMDVNMRRQLLITDNMSGDVHMVDLGQQYQMTDSYGIADNKGNMANVTGVVWDKATEGFFVATQQKNRGKGQVHYYSSNGVFVQTVVETKLNNPMGLALSKDNVLVVADMLSIKLYQKQ